MILVGIKMLLVWVYRFSYLCMGNTLEVHVQVLGQIPVDGDSQFQRELY